MSWKIPLLALLTMTAACGAFAQTIYKTIGPDGNARLLAHQRRVLLEAFNPAERQAIETKVKARTSETLAASSKHGPYNKSRWCEESLAQINSGSMDVASKPDILSPLANYRPKAP
jgi:hypothetical protein